MCWGHTQWLHCFNGLCNHFQRGFPILYQQRRNFGTTSVLHCLIHRPQTLLEKPVNGLLVFQERSYLLWVCALEPTWNIPVVCMLVFSFVLFLFSSISCFISPHLMGIKWIILLVCHLAFVSRKLKGAEMTRLYFVLFYVLFPFFF